MVAIVPCPFESMLVPRNCRGGRKSARVLMFFANFAPKMALNFDLINSIYIRADAAYLAVFSRLDNSPYCGLIDP